jgi:hypothetical protein
MAFIIYWSFLSYPLKIYFSTIFPYPGVFNSVSGRYLRYTKSIVRTSLVLYSYYTRTIKTIRVMHEFCLNEVKSMVWV